MIWQLRLSKWLWARVVDAAFALLRPGSTPIEGWRWRACLWTVGEAMGCDFALEYALNPPEAMEWDNGPGPA